MKLNEAIETWLFDVDMKSTSKYIYIKSLQAFIKFLFINNLKWDNLKKNDLINYRGYLLQKYDNISTVRNYMNVARAFCNYLSAINILPDNITFGIKIIKPVKEITKLPLKIYEIQKVLSLIDLTTKTGHRDKVIIETMITLGLRVSELISIDIEDIKRENDVNVIYIKGKNCIRKEQRMSLNSDIYNTLKNYIRERDKGPLFLSIKNTRLSKRTIQKMVKQRLNAAGLTGHKYSTHSLRHTTATLLIKQGVDIIDVMYYMRHSKTTTTEIYLKYIRNEQRLRNNLSAKIFNSFKKENLS